MLDANTMGELLVEEQIVDDLQLNEAKEASQKSGESLYATLVKLNLASEEALSRLLAFHYNKEYIEPDSLSVNPDALNITSKKTAVNFKAVPVSWDNENLTLAVFDPTDARLLDLEKILNYQGIHNIVFAMATPTAINTVIEKLKTQKEEEKPATKEEKTETAEKNSAPDAASIVNISAPSAKISALGQILLEENVITEEQLEKALEKQRQTGERLGNCLIELNYISEESLSHFLAIQHGTGYVDISQIEIASECVDAIPKKTALQYQIIPIEKNEDGWTFSLADWSDSALHDFEQQWSILHGRGKLTFMMTTPTAMKGALEKHYGRAATAPKAARHTEEQAKQQEPDEELAKSAENILLQMSKEKTVENLNDTTPSEISVSHQENHWPPWKTNCKRSYRIAKKTTSVSSRKRMRNWKVMLSLTPRSSTFATLSSAMR